MKPSDYSYIVNQIVGQAEYGAMRPVVEKEILQYEIIRGMEAAGLLGSLVFQGGMSLRLCWGGVRFSEDLDFVGGRDFDTASLNDISQCVIQAIDRRYGLPVSVTEPALLDDEADGRGSMVSRWQIKVTTAPDRPELPKQRIKIEVAAIDALSTQLRPLATNYDFLPDGYGDMFITCESLEEIMADKLVSLPAALDRYIRYRDLWDLDWLSRRNIAPNREMVASKISDYNIVDYPAKVQRLLHQLPGIVHGGAFRQQMSRFLPKAVLEQTVDRPEYLGYLEGLIVNLFSQD